jgi:hypothetical protein
LTTVEVGQILGEERQDGKTGPLSPATVRQYLAESKSTSKRGRFRNHPFPAPADRAGRSPIWDPGQEQAIREWARARLGAGARTDLARDKAN